MGLEEETSTVKKIRLLVDYYPNWNFRRIATELKYSYDYVRQVASQNRIWRYKKAEDIKKNVRIDECPICGSPLFQKEGEKVCVVCGFSKRVLDVAQILPFTLEKGRSVPTTYAWTAEMAFGHSLGNTLPPQQIHKVIAKAPAGQKDIGLRARLICIINVNVEPKTVKRLLEEGSKILKKNGLYKYQDWQEQDHVFANAYGRFLRKTGAFIHISHIRVRSYAAIAGAALYVLLKRHFTKRAEEIKSQLKFSEKELRLVEKLACLN